MLDAMKVAIDSAGRVVVPKVLRDVLRLEGGTLLEIRLRDGKIELEPVSTPMRLERRGRRLVATSDEPLPRLSAEDVRAVVESQRR
jgi:AbrB family looped-hinge helix DNA binding protein